MRGKQPSAPAVIATWRSAGAKLQRADELEAVLQHQRALELFKLHDEIHADWAREAPELAVNDRRRRYFLATLIKKGGQPLPPAEVERKRHRVATNLRAAAESLGGYIDPENAVDEFARILPPPPELVRYVESLKSLATRFESPSRLWPWDPMGMGSDLVTSKRASQSSILERTLVARFHRHALSFALAALAVEVVFGTATDEDDVRNRWNSFVTPRAKAQQGKRC